MVNKIKKKLKILGMYSKTDIELSNIYFVGGYFALILIVVALEMSILTSTLNVESMEVYTFSNYITKPMICVWVLLILPCIKAIKEVGVYRSIDEIMEVLPLQEREKKSIFNINTVKILVAYFLGIIASYIFSIDNKYFYAVRGNLVGIILITLLGVTALNYFGLVVKGRIFTTVKWGILILISIFFVGIIVLGEGYAHFILENRIIHFLGRGGSGLWFSLVLFVILAFVNLQITKAARGIEYEK